MIIRKLVRAPDPEGSDPTLGEINLQVEEDRTTAFGVTLDLGKTGVVLTVTQHREPDGEWTFRVSSSAEPGAYQRFGRYPLPTAEPTR